MKMWFKNLFHLVPIEAQNDTKGPRLFLVWALSFFLVIRSLAFLQFLSDLDYSETNPVRLTRFIAAQVLILMFLAGFIFWIWKRPRKLIFIVLMGLSFSTFWNNTDIVSVFSASLIFALSLKVYLSLFKKYPAENLQQQLPLDL